MPLTIGIIGLPNVGKSTTFNALTKAQNAQVANYPFCTIEPNQAIVPVPDDRLTTLQTLLGVPQAIPTTIKFVDIAGLVKGASRGEGLGNQFLGQIRHADALVHVVRCFDDDNVVHVSAQPDPETDIATINMELMLADMEQLERKLAQLERQVRGDRSLQTQIEMAQSLMAHLNNGRLLTTFPDQHSDTYQTLNAEMRFLTAKPVIFAANVDEATVAAAENEYVTATRAVATASDAELVVLCAQLEAELASLTDAEQQDFLELAGISEGGLDQVIRTGYRLLGLISFFTFNENEVRAWTVAEGATAPQAAGVIHTDFEKGFIRAEVLPFTQFMAHESWSAAKAAGAVQLNGREYVVQDGDIIYFHFNV